VPGVHELVLTRSGKTAYVSRRTATQLSRNGKQLTVGLRMMPAHLAVVDTRTFEYELVRLGPLLDTTTTAGHQWTSPNGRFTFAAFEGGTSPGLAVIDHRAGNRVENLACAGRPHGVDLASAEDDD
jgi:hypothetical protein